MPAVHCDVAAGLCAQTPSAVLDVSGGITDCPWTSTLHQRACRAARCGNEQPTPQTPRLVPAVVQPSSSRCAAVAAPVRGAAAVRHASQPQRGLTSTPAMSLAPFTYFISIEYLAVTRARSNQNL